MAQAIDMMLDGDGDIMIVNGDLVLGASDGQHIQHIFELEPGELKENVLVGLGINKKLNGNEADGDLRREATLQLQADGYTLKTPVIIEKKNIVIDAERNG
jgi:hypothetical protein